MSTAFLSGINKSRYRVMLNNLHNSFFMGRKKYPKMFIDAYDLAINWKGDTKGPIVAPNDGIVSTTDSKEADVNANDGMKIT